jgi:RNA polymerase sigma factor (TIGR02999 family)
MNEVTRILSALEEGDPHAAAQLLPLVYDELRKLAAAKLAQEKPGQTLQATALVHEAYLRLVGGGERSEVRNQKSKAQEQTSDLRPLTSDLWNSRGHFFAAAAEAMRRILIEQARRKQSGKAGGYLQRVDLDAGQITAPTRNIDLIALDEALIKLAGQHPRKCELVKLRYFAGLTIDQAAKVLGIATSTADADWAYVKSWLRLELLGEPSK